MEETQTEKKLKIQKPSRNTSLRVRKETKKRIFGDLARMNKKDLGKVIRTDDYLNLALSLIMPEHIQQLQESSLSHADRLERDYKNYVAKFGHITKDDYLGKRLNGEIESREDPHLQQPPANLGTD